jgi:retron-type reverse transcriptase
MDIYPIFKGGDQKLPNNYRPICTCQDMWKLLEAGFNYKIKLESLFSEHQHAFLRGRSTATLVKELMQSMTQIDNGILYKTDIKKAFDELNRAEAMKIFIEKVGHYKFLYKMRKLLEETEVRVLFDFGNTQWIKT